MVMIYRHSIILFLVSGGNMSLNNEINAFLEKYEFSIDKIKNLTNDLLFDMKMGLEKESDGTSNTSAEPMIIASKNIPKNNPVNESVIVIDAGGTNFRSCLVSFDIDGKASISDFMKTKMPGSDKELSKKDFYNQIADNIEHLRNKAKRIGFCFSYAMKNTPDGDAQVTRFSKEIKAPEVVGTFVGKSLVNVLLERGWNPIEKIVILNDTMASLLSGITNSSKTKKYSSYIGFILGTGLNNAYIEYNKIPKNTDSSTENIIVCEGGMYNRVNQSVFDKKVDTESTKPGESTLEKLCSGAYLGKIADAIVQKALEDGLFSDKLKEIPTGITPFDMDQFMSNPFADETKIGSLLKNGTQNDRDTIYLIFEAIIERSAFVVSSLLGATIIQSGKGTSPTKPICVVCNGTTFWKTHGLLNKVNVFLYESITKKQNRYFDIVCIENDITLGTAVAATI